MNQAVLSVWSRSGPSQEMGALDEMATGLEGGSVLGSDLG